MNDILSKLTAGDDEMASAWGSLLWIRTQRLVDSKWGMIIHLALRLDERKTLDGKGVERVIEDYSGRLDLRLGKGT